MQKGSSLVIVALMSSLLSVGLYRWFEPSGKSEWSDMEGEAKYTNFVDKLLNTRSNANLRNAAPTDFVQAAAVATPAVVNIRARIEEDGGFWGGGSVSGSSGSGVIMSPDGFIITNHHVVDQAKEIKVTLSDKREYRAELVGIDAATDIALLKIQENTLPFLLFGDSDSLQVGEWVLAVGAPFNLHNTVTAGIISAKGRNINILRGGGSIESFIQTDAAVNPGSSGGALVNTAGELIGINTAIVTESGNYEGYSFAVPSNLVQKIVRDLKDYGEVQRAFLGVGIENLDNETARRVGLPDAQGVHITRINSDGAAGMAGLRVGDVVVKVQKVRVRGTAELMETVGRFRPGDQIEIQYWRNGRLFDTIIRLKDKNNAATPGRYQGNEMESELGFALRDLRSEERRRFPGPGAMVQSVRRGSIIAATNMQPGYLIMKINRRRVSNIEEAMALLQNAGQEIYLEGRYEHEPENYAYRFNKPG